MAEIKDKLITVESLSTLHNYNKSTYETKANVKTMLNEKESAINANIETMSKNVEAMIDTKFDKPENNIAPIINGGTDASNVSDARANLEAQKQHITVSTILSINGWSKKTQVVNVDGVTNSNTIIVTPAPESRAAYNESDVHCSAQASGKLTFTCTQTPTSNLTVNVMILG